MINIKLHKLLLIFLLVSVTFLNGQNVGIGTTSPDEKLTVAGTIKAEINSNGNTPQLQIHEDDVEFGRIRFTNNASTQNFTLAGNPQPDSSASRFHIFKSDFGNVGSFTGHGRMGINASNPAATLHLNSQPNTDLLRVQNNNQTKLRMFANNAIVLGSNWTSPIPGVIRMETPNLFIGFDGDHVPEERLEVEGDVRITGAIKANNVNGTPGQILTTGSDGNIAWTNPCSYNRFQSFPIAGTTTWKVPSGVTEIMIELWGAGGGGSLGGGGGSGGYAKAIFTVIEGDVINVVTGAGGAGVSGGANQNASNGGTSLVAGTGVSAGSTGGGGATTLTFGSKGLPSIDPPYLSAHVIPGNYGRANITIPIYSGTNKKVMGNGGQSPNAQQNFGIGDVLILQGTSVTTNQGSSGQTAGGGGGGGNEFGNNGGDGLVIIKWNSN